MPDEPTNTGGAGGFDDHGELDREDFEAAEQRRSPAEVVAELADPGRPVPYHDLAALSSASNDTAAALLGLWPRLEPARRREVLAAMQRLGDEDPTLDFDRAHLSALHDADAATRILAIRGLFEQEREDVMLLLTAILTDDPEATVRAEAAGVLGQFVVSMEFGMLTEDGAEHLAEALRNRVEDPTEEDEVRGRAVEALGASTEEWIAEMIADQYETGAPRMRLASIRAMGRNASDDWLPIVIYNFDDDDAETRAAAATAAGQLLLESAVEPLMALIEDEDEEVQIAAIQALGEIAGDAAESVLVQLLSREPHIADAARHALAEARMLAIDSDADEGE